MSSKTAISILVALIIFAGIFVPVVSASTQEHIVIEQINSGATDGVDLGYYTPQEGKTSVEVYPDTVTVTADGGTVTIAYPAATKTITGDAILAIGGGSASSADDLNLYIQNGNLYNSGVEYSSCTIKCVDNINQGSLYIDLVLTGAKTTYLTPLVDWAYLPTLGGAYGSYTGDLAYTLSDVVSIGDFAGVYIASKGTDIISNNEYDLSATIERDADDNILGVKYAKAPADAAAVDGSASAYTGDDDGTVAVLTPEEWDGEDAAATTAFTPEGTLVNGLYYTTSGSAAAVTYAEDRTATSITIPETIEINGTTFTVTSIAGINSIYSTFAQMTHLKTITIPDSVTSIGHSAFSGCTSLALTSLPSGVTSIGTRAFVGCAAMTALIIQSSPTIATDAFSSTLIEVLNLGSTTLTTAMGITDRTVVSDSIESLAIVQQKQHINSYCEQKDGAVYDLVGMIPIIVLAGLAIAIVGMYAARRD